MSDTTAAGKPWKLKFNTVGEIKSEVNRLRSTPHRQIGQWTLPQISRHVGETITKNLTKPDSDTPTADETKAKNGFLGMVLHPMGMPDNMSGATTPADCTEGDVDALIAALDALEAYPHTHIKVGKCGPVAKSDVVKLHLVHAGHHLSFLTTEPQPTEKAGPMLEPPAGYRKLKYADVAEALADITKLKSGPYYRLGNWTLAMIARHFNNVLRDRPQPPATTVATPEQAEKKTKFVDYVLTHGGPPPGMNPPAAMMPADCCTAADVDQMEAGLKRIADYEQTHVDLGPMGPVTTEEFRKLQLTHLGHHLGFLVPVG